MRTVLVVCNLTEEYYYQPFVAEALKRNICFCVFDPSLFPADLAVEISVSERGEVQGFVDVFEYTAADSYRLLRLDFNQIDLGWYLRAGISSGVSLSTQLETDFARNESKMGVRSLLSVLPCRWVNSESKTKILENNKLYQQLIAAKSGLTTPSTVITNNHICLLDFLGDKDALLLKTIGNIRLDKEDRYFIYSELFEKNELSQVSRAIRTCPVFAQQYIPKKYEYRIMVIDTRILACRIDSQASSQTKIDWRHYDFDRVEHVASELPVKVQQKLRCFMTTIGLHYGAIDMIETPAGEFVFLEINPAGQWGWIADFAKLLIPEAVAEMLEVL